MALTLAAWIHACVGLHVWLRVQPWYDIAQPPLFAVALVTPIVAASDMLQAGARSVRCWRKIRVTWPVCFPPSRRLRRDPRSSPSRGASVSFFFGAIPLLLVARPQHGANRLAIIGP